MKFSEFIRMASSDIEFIVVISILAGLLSYPGHHFSFVVLGSITVAGFLSSASATIFNNLYDSGIDSNMKRTQYRTAIIERNRKTFLVSSTIMFLLALSISFVFDGARSAEFLLFGLLSYVVLYTIILKRRTRWSMVIGGISASFSILAGWYAAGNAINALAVYLVLLVFAWIPFHFWSFAASHNEDYKSAKIPMLPAVVGLRRSSHILLINAIVLTTIASIYAWFGGFNSLSWLIAITIIISGFLILVSIYAAIGEKLETKFSWVYIFSHIYISLALISAILGSFL